MTERRSIMDAIVRARARARAIRGYATDASDLLARARGEETRFFALADLRNAKRALESAVDLATKVISEVEMLIGQIEKEAGHD